MKMIKAAIVAMCVMFPMMANAAEFVFDCSFEREIVFEFNDQRDLINVKYIIDGVVEHDIDVDYWHKDSFDKIRAYPADESAPYLYLNMRMGNGGMFQKAMVQDEDAFGFPKGEPYEVIRAIDRAYSCRR